MKEFPAFMKNQANRVPGEQQHTTDIDGYYYEGKGGGQMAFWTHYADRVSSEHSHEYDEYMIVVDGTYTATMDGKEYELKKGDELVIPKGTMHGGRCTTGTRTIHAFGGKRIMAD